MDTRPLFLLGRKRAPRAYKGLNTRLAICMNWLERESSGGHCVDTGGRPRPVPTRVGRTLGLVPP